MYPFKLGVPVARLDEALSERLCVSAWLGYGDCLFLGLGEDVLPERGDDGWHSKAPFELETNFADWFVEGPMTARSAPASTDRAELEVAAKSLVGERVLSWELLDRNGLRVRFTGAKALSIAPWGAEDRVSWAWCVESPDGRILAVATDGRSVVVDAALPIRDWFDPAPGVPADLPAAADRPNE